MVVTAELGVWQVEQATPGAVAAVAAAEAAAAAAAAASHASRSRCSRNRVCRRYKLSPGRHRHNRHLRRRCTLRCRSWWRRVVVRQAAVALQVMATVVVQAACAAC